MAKVVAFEGAKKRGGRKPGSPNKVPALLKDSILIAAERAGGQQGLIGYLRKQAIAEPVAFLGLLGKILPVQIKGNVGGTVSMIHSAMSAKQAIESYARLLSANAEEIKQIEQKPDELDKEEKEEDK